MAVWHPAATSANGKAALVANEEQGPYRFVVAIFPKPAIVENTHMSLRLVELESEQTLTRAAVSVSAKGPHPDAKFGPLVADNYDLPMFFEVNLPFKYPGTWQVSINVNTELGNETITVEMDVREGRPINLALAAAAVAIVALTVGIWTYDRIRAGRRRKAGG